jgi:hypothetical protein
LVSSTKHKLKKLISLKVANTALYIAFLQERDFFITQSNENMPSRSWLLRKLVVSFTNVTQLACVFNKADNPIEHAGGVEANSILG